MKSLFLFLAYGEKGNQESMTVLSYQFHNNSNLAIIKWCGIRS